ncbi:UNVERIFIED_CONTAM: hypothetical protein ABID98_000605 [Brevibacillus sp. OAP136]
MRATEVERKKDSVAAAWRMSHFDIGFDILSLLREVGESRSMKGS